MIKEKKNEIKFFHPKKFLGQHFILDPKLSRRIVAVAGDISSGTTIEVGPGLGSLTKALLESQANVIAIEKDKDLMNRLEKLAEDWPNNLSIIEKDAKKVDISRLGETPRRIIANLPYNIATELLVSWLKKPDSFSTLTVMLQKEVAQRIVASPGSKIYGRLSILANWHWQTSLSFHVNPKVFIPPPKVDSSIIHFTSLHEPIAPAEIKSLEKITSATFGQRRKMIRSSLKIFGDPEKICLEAGVDSTLRPEQITIEKFCALARAYNTCKSL